MNNPPPSDGNRTASDPGEWLERHGDVLFRFALTRVGDRDVAEDLVQETLLAALKSRDRFAQQSTEQTWLVAILRFKVADYFRRLHREPARNSVENLGQVLSSEFDEAGYWKTGTADWFGDPGQALQDREFWDVFRECLAKLPEMHADAFCLREFEEQTTEEICKTLGISATNLGVRLYRARMSLRRCLELNWFSVTKPKGK